MEARATWSTAPLCIVSCKKEDNAPIRNHEFGNCLKDEEPLSSEGCNVFELQTSQYCEVIHSPHIFSLSETAGDWLPYYCCEKGDTIPYLNQQGKKINLSILGKSRSKTGIQVIGKCESDSSKNIIRCSNFEKAIIYIESALSEQVLNLHLWPDFEADSLESLKLGAHLNIYNDAGRTNNHIFSFPVDWTNLTKPIPYDYQYIPEIEILGKTFFEVYTHEEELKGFYTKIYYNKEFGIVSFVDETGVQWRVDL